MSSFYNGYAIVYKKGKAGVINRTGTLEIACEYESLKYLGDGILVAILNGKSGIIDIDNNILVAFDYDQSTVQMNKYIKMTTPNSILWFDIKSRKIFWKGLP